MSRAPRVLVSGVVLGQPMGGVRRHNAELLPRAARALAAEGGRLALLEGRTPPVFELPPEVERITAPVPARPAILRAPAESLHLRRALARAARAGEPFDLVHTAHLPAPAQLGLPFALTVHDLRSLELAHTSISRRAFGRFVVADGVQRARVVIAVSEKVRASLVERFGLDPARVRVVPNAADHLRPLPRRPRSDAPLLHVGHVEARKNLELLVRALALAPDLPDLYFAGAAKHGEDERLARLAEELGVAPRVRFRGPFDDAELAELYAEAACVVLPSRLEGFGIPALEARVALVPLAASSAGALPEVAGPAAQHFDPDDAAACARAVRAALATPPAELQRSRDEAARYSWDVSAALLVEAWRSAIER